MVLDQAANMLVKLCSCGPLLYVGVLLAIDPASVVRLSGMVARGLHQLGHGLRGFPWPQGGRELEEPGVSAAWRLAVRFIGLALAACAVLYLTGVN
jgi:hypothetical protein